MNNYEYSKFLYTMFYKNCCKVDGWREFSNEYIEKTEDLIKRFFEYKQNSNQQMLELFQKTSISGEFEKIKILKTQWLEFVKLFGEAESFFEEKYRFLTMQKQPQFQQIEDLKVFLAEYTVYEKMSAAYQSLLNLDMQLENYQKMCQFYKYQLQPI